MKRVSGWGMALLAGLLAAQPALAQDARGDWWGTLQATPQVALRVQIHIKPAEGQDGLAGTFDSLDQNANGIPMSDIAVKDGVLSFRLPAVAGSFAGKWDAAVKGWRGTWTQNGALLPLVLNAGTAPAGSAPPSPAPLPANWSIPANDVIAQLIDTRIAERKGEGIVIGVLDASGRRVVARGPAGATTFDGRTLFEIGSMSKVFTAIMLADMALKQEVSLDDPAEKYLPAGHRMPERNGRKITLRDLAMHVSGLPRLPDNMAFADMDDPYADYGEAQLLAFLDRYQLPRDIGGQYEYSNFGMGVLGYLLARRNGTDYETMLRQRITGPLGMRDTSIALSPDQKARFAQGHDMYMRPAKPWNLTTLAGAGGIRSTGDDMLTFLAAALDPKSPIGPAVGLTLQDPRATANPRLFTGLAWSIGKSETGDVAMHDGGTGGFRTVMVLDRAKQRAVVVLTNAAVEPSATDLGIHLMAGAPMAPAGKVPPAPPATAAHTEIKLPAAQLDRVVGTYQVLPNLQLKLWREGEELKAQMSGAPVFPLYAEAPLRFFWKVVDAQVRFIEEGGVVTGAELSQQGQVFTGKKLP